MKITLIFAGLAMAISSSTLVVMAQTKPAKPKPDFSGEWLLDLDKSDKKLLPPRPDLPIKISHQDPELKVITTSESKGQMVERVFVYYTDGRGETNQATALLTTNPDAVKPGDIDKQVTKSKTSWRGDKVVTRATLRLVVGSHVLEYELVDEWKLSRDGKVLTKTSRTVFQQSDTMFIPAMVPETKKVYNRS
jgi:hypothetical protein